MCGRYARGKDKAALVEEFAIQRAPEEDLSPDFNVAPTKRVYLVVARKDPQDAQAQPQRSLEVARWGLVPSWAKDPSIGSRLINARIETAASKPAFRKAFAARRCLIPADGFYEWYQSTQVGKGGKPVKQPFFIHAPNGRSLALAGLFEFWRDRAADDDQPWLVTVTILTTTSTDALGRIHDRMPLPIREGDWDRWLDPSAAPEQVQQVLDSHVAGELTAYPVSTAVNNVRNNGPDLMEPLPPGA